MDYLLAVAKDPIVALVGLLIGTLIGILGVILTWRSLRLKRLCWAIKSNNLVRDHSATVPELTFTYRDQRVASLTVSKIVLWNRCGADL